MRGAWLVLCALLRFQANYSAWSIYVRVGTRALDTSSALPSSDVFVYVSEGDRALPQALQGSWQSTSGTSTLTTVDQRAGGRLVGSASGTLTELGTPANSAPFSLTFDAQLPP